MQGLWLERNSFMLGPPRNFELSSGPSTTFPTVGILGNDARKEQERDRGTTDRDGPSGW